MGSKRSPQSRTWGDLLCPGTVPESNASSTSEVQNTLQPAWLNNGRLSAPTSVARPASRSAQSGQRLTAPTRFAPWLDRCLKCFLRCFCWAQHSTTWHSPSLVFLKPSTHRPHIIQQRPAPMPTCKALPNPHHTDISRIRLKDESVRLPLWAAIKWRMAPHIPSCKSPIQTSTASTK